MKAAAANVKAAAASVKASAANMKTAAANVEAATATAAVKSATATAAVKSATATTAVPATSAVAGGCAARNARRGYGNAGQECERDLRRHDTVSLVYIHLYIRPPGSTSPQAGGSQKHRLNFRNDCGAQHRGRNGC